MVSSSFLRFSSLVDEKWFFSQPLYELWEGRYVKCRNKGSIYRLRYGYAITIKGSTHDAAKDTGNIVLSTIDKHVVTSLGGSMVEKVTVVEENNGTQEENVGQWSTSISSIAASNEDVEKNLKNPRQADKGVQVVLG
ncbi:hypothetical protein Tco_1288698 [Tanacetum coccineum]